MPGSGHWCTRVAYVCYLGFPGSYWAMRDLICMCHHACLWQDRCQNQFNIRENVWVPSQLMRSSFCWLLKIKPPAIVETSVNPQKEAVGGILAPASSGHFGHSTGFVLFSRWRGVLNAVVFTSVFSQSWEQEGEMMTWIHFVSSILMWLSNVICFWVTFFLKCSNWG